MLLQVDDNEVDNNGEVDDDDDDDDNDNTESRGTDNTNVCSGRSSGSGGGFISSCMRVESSWATSILSCTFLVSQKRGRRRRRRILIICS